MAIQVFQVRCDPDLHATMHSVAMHLTPTSRKTYICNVKHFARWMSHRDLTLPLRSREEARALLNAIDRSTALDKRDYALIMLLLRMGLRRSKAEALTLSDFTIEHGYHVVVIRHCTSWTQ